MPSITGPKRGWSWKVSGVLAQTVSIERPEAHLRISEAAPPAHQAGIREDEGSGCQEFILRVAYTTDFPLIEPSAE